METSWYRKNKPYPAYSNLDIEIQVDEYLFKQLDFSIITESLGIFRN